MILKIVANPSPMFQYTVWRKYVVLYKNELAVSHNFTDIISDHRMGVILYVAGKNVPALIR